MSLLQILEVAGKRLTVVNASCVGKTTNTSSNPSVEIVSSGAGSESDPKGQADEGVVESEPNADQRAVDTVPASKDAGSSNVAKKGSFKG
jgi:hypothetical protein